MPAVDAVDPVVLPELVEPVEDAAELPPDGMVGRGALVYQPCRMCDEAVLVLDGGEQLRLPGTAGAAVLGYSLSPDGRWLTAPDQAGAVVRDLTGEQLHVIEAAAGYVLAAWAWSPDSRWVLFSENELTGDGAALTGYRLVDTMDGSDTGVSVPSDDREFVAVRPSGQLLAMDVARDEWGDGSGPAVTTVDAELTDPFEPEGKVALTLDAREWLNGGETLADTGFTGGVQLIHAPGGEGYLLTVYGAAGPAAMLQADFDGQVKGRLELTGVDGGGSWRIAGQLGGELVAAQARAMPDELAFSWALYAVVDGSLRDVTTLAPAAIVRLPGTAAHGGSML
jgi:hypothetical protein